MWALHPRELSIIVACIKYVKDLFCEGGLLLSILYTAKIEQKFYPPKQKFYFTSTFVATD
jgi:hypothetical protein